MADDLDWGFYFRVNDRSPMTKKSPTFPEGLQFISCEVLGLFLVIDSFALAGVTALLTFFLKSNLQQFHVSFERGAQASACSSLSFKNSNAVLHFLAFNLPGISISFMSMPLGLQESHHTYCSGQYENQRR